MKNGAWSDFISDFLSFTEYDRTPLLHRRWAGISLLAGALERRVWVENGDRLAFPNLYVLLVAPPGTGKYIVETVRDLWTECCEPGCTEARAFHVAPDSVSAASFVDDLAKAKRTFLPSEGPPYTYHSLLVASEDFEVLLPSYDPLMIARLNSLFNNKRFHRETRRHGPSKDTTIDLPQLNILAGAQPAYFTAHFPEEAWATGLVRRIIMVFAHEPPLASLFTKSPGRQQQRAHLLARLSYAAAMYGPAVLSPDSQHQIDAWHLSGEHPRPTHSKLVNYVRTRAEFVLKLSLISAVSRTGELLIAPIDVTRAMEWLFEAEALMPDIFRAMVGKSDVAVIEELHYFMQTLWVSSKKSIPGLKVREFLAHRLPSEKIPSVLDLALGMDVIAKIQGQDDQWIPRPKHVHGVE